jgi:hypothetical protein
MNHERTDELVVVAEFWTYPLRWGDTLSNHDWVPLHINRLLTSDFLTYAVAEDRRADIGTALILWCECFKQDPAGTLPDDDVALAQIARFGRDLDGWLKVKAGALHGWRPAAIAGDADGRRQRLGHPVIAEIAADMFRRKSGRDAAREASRLSTLRNRVRAKIKALGYRKPFWDSNQVVNVVAEYLDRHRLYATDENVRLAMTEAAGIPRDVAVLGGRGSDDGEGARRV